MVSSAVLGAAAGTGLALVIAVTIVVYRYYSAERKVRSWSSLDRWPEPPKLTCKNPPQATKLLKQQLIGQQRYNGSTDLEACRVFDSLRKSHTCYYGTQNTEFNFSKEQQHAIQPTANDSGTGHQSSSSSSSGCGTGIVGVGRSSSVGARSMGLGMGRALTGSGGSLSGSIGSTDQPEQSSPQIRAYGPDGRHHNHEALHAASSYPPSRSSRKFPPGEFKRGPSTVEIYHTLIVVDVARVPSANKSVDELYKEILSRRRILAERHEKDKDPSKKAALQVWQRCISIVLINSELA
ncbi:hypothetical protein QAD02_006056 [Eretmocerus hayati]|uniref:Uncharacterized protein n=1 Tax=Eretmocerus hayati TaxID=131215 RepID=A0ACC2N093_9HYME|nr:hypothetical protein QAD02_006056 [Eretmocerus hayati]